MNKPNIVGPLASHHPITSVNEGDELRLCVIITSFNRREKTINCIESLFNSQNMEQRRLSILLIDDGSSDGTAEAITTMYPQVEVIIGDGNLFWCRGMHLGFSIAMQYNYDYYLWLNDDTMLRTTAISMLLNCEMSLRKKYGKPVIVVGSTADPDTGLVTYGGQKAASSLKQTKFLRMEPGDRPLRCDSMNGNIVLIPKEVAEIVGNLDPVFEHALGDTDYALRARKLGIGVWLAPHIYGTCSSNSPAGTYMDPGMPLSIRWQLMMSRKGLPWRSWLAFTRRHTGIFWPLYFSFPYVSLVIGRYGKKSLR